MAWEWISPAGTVVVALAGIGGTMFTAAQGRKHAEHLATENHQREREEMLRRERLRVYAGALAHAMDQERKLDAVWASNGEHAYNITPEPPGAPLPLTSRDEITVQMRLLADEEVEQAWAIFVSAWEEYHWWAQVEHGGAPDEKAPEDMTQQLRNAIEALKATCRASLR